MPLTQGRFNLYRKLSHDAAVIVFNINPLVTYNEGDVLWFDKVSGNVLPIGINADGTPANAAQKDAQTLLYAGIALATNPVAHHPRPITKMAIYYGDLIAKMFIPGSEAMSYMTPAYIGANPQSCTTVAGALTESLGNLIMDSEEFKTPRNSSAGEEISILLRQSVIITRQF